MIASLHSRYVPRTFIIHQLLTTALGALIVALGINLFFVPHHFVSGGFSGLALFAAYFTPLPVGVWVALFNIPLFVVAWMHLGRRFVLASLYGVGMLSLFLLLTESTAQLNPVRDPIIATVLGGVLSGVGIGMCLRVNASLGGTDVIGAMVRKQTSISIGTLSFIINAVIIAGTATVMGTNMASYALLSIFCTALAADKTIVGLNTSKAVFIITAKHREIALEIMEHLNRGVTFLHAEGAYYGNERRVIYSVVSLRQLARVKYYVQSIDPSAFMAVADVSEVLGKGFKPSPF